MTPRIKLLRRYAICSSAVLSVVSCTTTPVATPNNPYNVKLGAIGHKEGRGLGGFGMSYGAQPTYTGNITFDVKTEAHDARSKKWAVDAQASVASPVGGAPAGVSPAHAGVTGSRSANTEASYKLITITGDVVSALNSPSNSSVLEQLKRYGPDARIITSVWQTYGYNSSSSSSGSLSISGSYSVAQGSLSGSGSKDVSTTLSDGTIFNYTMSKICWMRDSATGNVIVGNSSSRKRRILVTIVQEA